MPEKTESIEEPKSTEIIEIEKPQLFQVEEPRKPQGPEALKVNDYFNISRAIGLILWPDSKHPVVLPPIDFCFGSGEDLSLDYLWQTENHKAGLTADDMTMEINQLISRLVNWDSEKGDLLKDRIVSLLVSAKKVAYVTCHGNTYDDPDGPIWGLTTVDVTYGADRITKALINEGYDLIIFNSCNPDNIPLFIEKDESTTRPNIVRFTTNNNVRMPKNITPIKIISAIN